MIAKAATFTLSRLVVLKIIMEPCEDYLFDLWDSYILEKI